MRSMYPKALLAVLVSALGALVAALGTGATDTGDIDAKSWLIAGIAVLGSGGMVWLTQNGPAAPYIKSVMAFLSAGMASLVISLDDNHLSRAEELTALAAAIVATGFVFQFAGSGDPPDGGAVVPVAEPLATTKVVR